MALPPHIPVAVKIFPHLVECAKAGRRTTYEEMGAAAGLETRLFSRPLAFIRDFVCAERNLPPLTILVQRKGGTAASNRIDPVKYATMSSKEYAELEAKMVAEVFAYDKWDRTLEGLQAMFPHIKS
jgi:hypothetical protein